MVDMLEEVVVAVVVAVHIVKEGCMLVHMEVVKAEVKVELVRMVVVLMLVVVVVEVVEVVLVHMEE